MKSGPAEAVSRKRAQRQQIGVKRRTAVNAVILACSSLEKYVAAAQEKMKTDYPVITIDRAYHAEPEDMKKRIEEMIAGLPEEVDTVLVAMAFCGGAWDHVTVSKRVVIPKADDCVSILLHTGEETEANLKESGHLYIYEQNPADFGAVRLMNDSSLIGEEYRNIDREMLMHMWFDQYHHMDIIDTGYNDCYTEAYAAAAQEQADQIGAELDYTAGSNTILEKLVSGKWETQFIVAEAGKLIRHADFFD